MLTFVVLLLVILRVVNSLPDGEPSSKLREDESLVVTTPMGPIRGSILESRTGKDIYSFRGIRYARPPINELRFKPPVPVDSWTDIYDATEDGPICPQPTSDPTSEDCLYINVYTTKLPANDDEENTKRPVIVYIHSGGWYSVGSASYWAGPQYLLEHDIVLVTFNYRLGSLGFLSTGDKESPGNYGMKDQVLALKWVKVNIESFGGDPDLITLTGYGSGAASVILHMISPMSKGLFARAIAMSGSPLGQWPIGYHQFELARKQARLVGCPSNSSEEIVECLMTRSANELGDSLLQFAEFGDDPVIIWTPVIEEDFGEERFLTEHPHYAIFQDFYSVPLMLGVTTDEFAWRAFTVLGDETLTQQMNDEFDRIAPISFIYERNTTEFKMASKALKDFYLNGKPLDNSSLSGLGDLYADTIIGYGVNMAAKKLSVAGDQPVYYYQFSYKGRYSHFFLPESNNSVPYTVVHHDDLMYLFYFKNIFPFFLETDPEMEIVKKMTLLWSNFAKTGNPTPEVTEDFNEVLWEPFVMETQKYLEINEHLVMRERLYDQRYTECQRIFSEYEITKHTKKPKPQ